MAQITFYTKSNCKNAVKQIELLHLAGHNVQVIDLLSYEWTEEKLKHYFAGKSPDYWFNPKAPAISSGEIDPTKYSEKETIKLLLEDHILIRRPIIDVEGTFQIGFDKEKIDTWIGLQALEIENKEKFSADVTTCNQTNNDNSCV